MSTDPQPSGLEPTIDQPPGQPLTAIGAAPATRAGTLTTAGALMVGHPASLSLLAIPGYEMLGELGRGGMGVVFKARQIKANRLVALKMILAGADAAEGDRTRFHTEVEAIARVQHPNIVQVFEVGEYDGLPFFSLEFCEGGSLTRKLAGKPLPVEEAAEVVEKLARAMHAAHAQKVIHRDLKPANVLLLADGTPKITDFGLAKKLDDAGQTRTGAVMGSPSYMAPEQAAGNTHAIGPLTDIYALGAILYECLTGQPPFRGETIPVVLDRVINVEPVPPTSLNPGVPRDLETICLKCLSKDPSRRYESALRLAQDLERFRSGDAILARREGLPRKLWRKVRRHRVLVGASLGVLLALALAWVFFLREGQVRRALDLDSQAEEAIKRIDGSKASLDQAEQRIADLVVVSSEKAGERTRELHQGLARWVQDQLRSVRLTPGEKETVNEAIDWLQIRDADLAGALRTSRDERFTRTDAVFELHGGAWKELPDVFDSQFVRQGNGDYLERVVPPEKSGELLSTLKDGRDDVQLEATFDAPFERGAELGLTLLMEQNLDHVAAVQFSSDGQALLLVEKTGRITVWSPASGKLIKELGRTPNADSVVLAAAGSRLLAGWIEPDAVVVRQWDSASFQPGPEQRYRIAGAIGVALNAAGTVVAAVDREGSVTIRDLAEGKESIRLTAPAGLSPVLALSADGKQAALAQGEALLLWDIRRNKEPRRLETGQCKALALAFSPSGDRLASAQDTTTMLLWDLVAGGPRPIHHAGLQTPKVGVAFSPDGQLLAAIGNGNQTMFQARDLQERWSLSAEGRSLSFSPDAQLLAYPAASRVEIRQVEDGRQQARIGSQNYLFKVIAPPTGDRKIPPLETIHQRGGKIKLQILRNGGLLREEERTIAAGPLTLRAVKEGDRLRFQVNTTPVLLFRDVFPGEPRQGKYAVFWPGGRLLALRAEQKPLARGIPLEKGDELFGQGRFADALAFYQAQARTAAAALDGKPIERECDCKAGLCLEQRHNIDQALRSYRKVAEDPTAPRGEPWPLLAGFRLWEDSLRRNDFTEAERYYLRIERLDPEFTRSTVIIPREDRERIWSLYMKGGNVDRYFLLSPDEMVRRQRIAELSQRFELPAYQRVFAFYTLLTGLQATGQEREALALFERIKPALVATQDTSDQVLPQLLGHWAWLLRRDGRSDEALKVLERCPPMFDGLMRMERTRIHAARGEFDLAWEDVQQAKKQLGERTDFLVHCQLYLMEGFLLDRKGEKAAAKQAWQRGRFKNWGKFLPEGDRLRQLRLGLLPIIFNWITTSLAEELDEAEAKEIVSRLIEIVSTRPELAALAVTFGPSAAVVGRTWNTPRGKECARQMAFQDVSFVEFVRLPMIALGAQYCLQDAFDARAGKQQEELVWKLCRDVTDAFFKSELRAGQAKEILQIWSGPSGYKEWDRLNGTLPELIRGSLAYLLGHRCERKLAFFRRQGDPLSFYEAAARSTLPPGLRALAETEVSRLKKKPSP